MNTRVTTGYERQRRRVNHLWFSGSLSKSALVLVAVAGAALFLGVYVTTRLSEPHLERMALADLEETAYQASDKIDRNLFERSSNALAFAQLYVARHWDEVPPGTPHSEAARATETGRARLIGKLNELTRTYAPAFRLLVMADAEGRIVACNTIGPEGRSAGTETLIGRDVSRERWFRECARADFPNRRPFIEDLHEDPLVAEVYGDRGLALSFSSPVLQDSRLVGVMSTRFNWSVAEAIFEDVVTRQRRNGAHSLGLTVLRQDGLTLFSDVPSEVLQRKRAGDQAARSAIDGPAPGAAGGFPESPRDPGTLRRSFRSRGYSTYSPSLGWVLVATRSRDDALREAASLKVRSLGFGAAGLVLLLAAILFAEAARQGVRLSGRSRKPPVLLLALSVAALIALGAWSVRIVLDQDKLTRDERQTARIFMALSDLHRTLEGLAAPSDDIFAEWDVPGQELALTRNHAALTVALQRLRNLLDSTSDRESILAAIESRAEESRMRSAESLKHAAEREHLRQRGASERELRLAEGAVAKTMLAARAATDAARHETVDLEAEFRQRLESAHDQAGANVARLFLLGGLAALCGFAALALGWRQTVARMKAQEGERMLLSLADVAPGAEPVQIFAHLAKAMASGFRCRWAMVGRLLADGRTIRTLGFWDTDHIGGNSDYSLDGTPCERVMEEAMLCHYERDVASVFPSDGMCRQIGASGFIARPLLDPSGRAIGILNAFHDGPLPVSPAQETLFEAYVRRAEAELSRLLAAESLAASETTHRTVMETLADGVVTIDCEGAIQVMNPAAERVFGWGPGEAAGRNVTELMPEACRSAHRAALARHNESGEARLIGKGPVQIEGLRRDGTVFPLEISITSFEIGGERFFNGILRDISERRRMEAEIRRLARAAESVADAIIMTDTGGDILWVNPAFTTITGYEKEDVLGQNPRLLKSGIHTPEFFRSLWAEISAGKIWSGRLHDRRKDGALYHAAMTIAPLTSDDGKITGYVAVQRDITPDVEREREIEAARQAALDASRLKSEFLANMSHEIRTPMNGIIGFVDLLLDTKLDREQHEYLETVRVSSEALLSIINDILDFSKIEAGKLDFEAIDFDLRTLVESVAELQAPQAQEKGLEFLCAVSPQESICLRGDPTRLRQVLLNLTANAVKFTEKGEVALQAEAKAADGHIGVRFLIRDTGIGIPEGKRDRLFKVFSQVDGSTTRRYGGTGLGLAISQRLVEAMGGAIEMESEPGAGSTFAVTLTLERALEGAAAEPAHSTLAEGLRVLVVDDNAANRSLLMAVLSSFGCQPLSVAGGREALAALREAARSIDPFDLALLDMQMPDLDGLQLARAIRAEADLPKPALILLTSIHQAQTTFAKEAGFAAALTKPVKRSVLLDAILNALPRRDRPPETAHTPQPVPQELPQMGTSNSRLPRILLAEDNPVNQRVALALLSKAGFQADVAQDGREAVEATARTHYDLVLMDLHMPEMNGYEATAAIRQREGTFRHTPIIALTASAMNDDREHCLRAGMDDFLSKPVGHQELIAVLSRWLRPDALTSQASPTGPTASLPEPPLTTQLP